MSRLLARAAILALLLLAIDAGVASADPGGWSPVGPTTTTFPDDPGYDE